MESYSEGNRKELNSINLNITGENMRKSLLKAFTILLVATILSGLPVAQASPGTIELIGKLWNHDPITVYIHASPKFQTYVEHVLTALNDWSSRLQEASDNFEAFKFEIVDSRKDADIVIHIHGGAYAGVLGIAILQDKDRNGYFDKVRITVKIGPGATLEDFRNVVRHEIGHALGLGHEITEEQDLMDPTYDASAINYDIYPSPLDIEALLYIYGTDGFGLPNLLPEEIPETYSA